MTARNRETFLRDSRHTQPKFKTIAGFFKRPAEFTVSRVSNILLALILALSFLKVPASSAQSNQAFVRQVRALTSDETGLTHPTGLAF